MKQDAKGQVPGVDLTFADNRTGRIWGTAGVDDLRAGTFVKALASVRKRADQEQAFEWDIRIELEQVVTTAQLPLVAFLRGLNLIVREGKPGQRVITINWRVRAQNLSLLSLARTLEEEFAKQKEPKVTLNVIVVVRPNPGSKGRLRNSTAACPLDVMMTD